MVPEADEAEASSIASTVTTRGAEGGLVSQMGTADEITIPISENSDFVEQEMPDPCEDSRLDHAEYCQYTGSIQICEERPEAGLCDAEDWFYRHYWLRTYLIRFSHDNINVEDTFVEGYESSCCYRVYSFNAGR